MSEYIDKNELLTTIGEKNGRMPLWLDEILMECKAADVVPVVHAYWKGYHTQDPCCSNCGFSYDREQGEDAQTTDYCGNCGAKMDGRNGT